MRDVLGAFDDHPDPSQVQPTGRPRSSHRGQAGLQSHAQRRQLSDVAARGAERRGHLRDRALAGLGVVRPGGQVLLHAQRPQLGQYRRLALLRGRHRSRLHLGAGQELGGGVGITLEHMFEYRSWRRPRQACRRGAATQNGHRTRGVRWPFEVVRSVADGRGVAAGEALGSGPCWLSPWLSWTRKTMRMMAPTIGTKAISCHHPVRPVSCRRRAPTASDGQRHDVPEHLAADHGVDDRDDEVEQDEELLPRPPGASREPCVLAEHGLDCVAEPHGGSSPCEPRHGSGCGLNRPGANGAAPERPGHCSDTAPTRSRRASARCAAGTPAPTAAGGAAAW